MPMSVTIDADGAEYNPLTDLTGFKRDILVAIESLEATGPNRDLAGVMGYEEPTGQCILNRLEQTGYDVVNHGRLYPNLSDLAELGLVEKQAQDERTNAYTLTAEGQEALEGYRAYIGA